MREIKFRAWIVSEKAMIQHREVIERAHLQFEDKFNYSDIVMQYTGLKDKNGKEIYEGDIIDDCGRNWLVKNSEAGSWMLDYKNGSGEKYLYPLNKHIEVIGNIYETNS
jgi:uncharacterized phage protein (TIGR01671 family)